MKCIALACCLSLALPSLAMSQSIRQSVDRAVAQQASQKAPLVKQDPDLYWSGFTLGLVGGVIVGWELGSRTEDRSPGWMTVGATLLGSGLAMIVIGGHQVPAFAVTHKGFAVSKRVTF